MSTKTVPCDIYENRSLRKQIGCMNGLFQLFGRHHFLIGWHTNSHKQKKRLPLGAQHQLEPHNATKAVIDRDLEVQKQGSLDYNKTNISESPFRITAKKEHGPSLCKGPQSPHIRDVVKDSMYREARGVPIKSLKNDEQKVTIMKHVDSPRPLHKPKFEKPKAKSCEESNRVFARDERLTLHRLSYDGRESGDTLKTKHKELPRLSLDSNVSSAKCSGLDSRLKFLGPESGSHSRASSIVAKLMGLDGFPETITTDENKITKTISTPSPRVAFPSYSSTTTEESKEKQTSFSKSTMSSRLPMEPAPWKQKDYSQNSPKMAAQNRKSPKITSNLPSSPVYAEMEKRVTELEYKRPRKDLRALKQILEAMQKTREKLENERREPAELQKQKRYSSEDSCSNRDSLRWQHTKTYQQSLIPPEQSHSSARITNSAKVMERVKISNSGKVPTVEKTHIQSLNTKYHRENPARREETEDIRPSRRFSSIDKKITRRNSELERTLRTPQLMRVENCTKLRQNVTSSLSSESGRVKKHSSNKAKENCYRNRKVKSMDFQLSDDQLSELSSEPRYSSYQGDAVSVKSESNYSVASHLETEVISLASSTNPSFREQQNSVSKSKEHMPAVELAEQPSPVSVLDTAFYTEDSPSPVKKISTAFQDESPGPDEAEWSLENLNHFSGCTQSNPGYKYNQISQDIFPLIHAPRLLKTEPSQTTVINHNESIIRSLIPDHRYIIKILKASGLFKDTCIMPTANQCISSHLINPDSFHVLEEMEKENGEFTEKNNSKELNQKMQRRIVFDTVNEILVRKITTAGIFTLGKKRMSPERLVNDIYLEMDHLCGMPYGNIDEDDGSIRLLTADMKHQSDDWTDYNGEVPALVLEIERLIFKDLINEVVTGQVECLCNWTKKHCRQLFTK